MSRWLPLLLFPALLFSQEPADFQDQLPRIPARSPQEALKTFQLRPGFRIELAAAEPHVQSPVAIDFDEDGRMVVAEFPEYNQYANPGFKGKGRVRRLEDTDGDGLYEKSTVLVDDLDSPAAVCCYDGGVFVGAVPNLWYFKDTKGDGKVDVRKIVLTGFARDHAGEGMLNSFQFRFDNRVHLSTSSAGGLVRREGTDDKPVTVKSQNIRLDPRTLAWERTSGGGQHGMTVDDWGRTFVCSNSDPMSVLNYDGKYLARNPFLTAPAPLVRLMPEGGKTRILRASPIEPWRALRTKLRKMKLVPGSDEGGSPAGFFTGATGVTAYRGHAWPEEFKNQLFVGEVSGNLVFRAEAVPAGVGFTGRRLDPDCEFLASTDNWFRPVQFAIGPDGNLYVIDMYRELIEGAAFLPPQILKHMDPAAGIDKGRIWRIVREDSRREPLPRLSQAKSRELVALLEHPNGWHRDTASRLLYQRQDPHSIPPLKDLVQRSESPLARLHALFALAGQKSLDAATLLKGLIDFEPKVREQALKLAEDRLDDDKIRTVVLGLVGDRDRRVRYQLAFSLGQAQGTDIPQALVQLAKSDGDDSWFQLAILSSVQGRRGELFHLLLAEETLRRRPGIQKLLASLAIQMARSGSSAELASFALALDNLPAQEKALAEKLVQSLAAGASAKVRQQLGQGRAGELLQKLAASAKLQAQDSKVPLEDRVQAIHLLASGKFADVQPVLAQLLHQQQPTEVQQAVLQSLGQFADPEVPSVILEAWPRLSPKLRASAAETLFTWPAWIGRLLDAVEKKLVARADLDPARLALLASHPDLAIQKRAAAVFPKTAQAGRQEIVARYQKALELKGDIDRGRGLFRKECAACHRLEGVGNQLGADLNAIRNRGPDATLLNILDPNREVLPQFVSYLVVLENGRTLTGMIAGETATNIVLHKPDGTSETLLRLHIEELRSTGLSFMPEGMEKVIDLQGMADLLAYFGSLK